MGNMLLTVTVQVDPDLKMVDIQVNSENYIIDTLRLLDSKGIIKAGIAERCTEVYSIRNKEYIDTSKTFAQGNIYMGDILRLEDIAYGN